jgi:hypothetical protein
MWVHPNSICFVFAIGYILIGPLEKNIMIFFIHPKYKHFPPIWGYGICGASF